MLWRALGKAGVLHHARRADPARTDLGPLILLSTDLPAPRSPGGKALRAVQGDADTAPVTDALALLDPLSAPRLRAYANHDG